MQKAIVASGHASNESAELAVKMGLAWLNEPYDIETLARLVERVMRGHQPVASE